MEQFLTAVTKDVDAYWTKTFKDSGLPEPGSATSGSRPARPRPAPAATTDGTLGDSAAAYCSGDDTIYISEKFATDIYNGALDQALPGSSQGYGRTVGDFSVAYIVAHEYGHEVQDELGLFQKYGQQLPTMAFELQADCYAGTWAKSAYKENRLEDGDVQEALDAALAVGDFDATNPSHHGTPEQREEAWNSGFESGDPSSCSRYLDPANLGDGGAARSRSPVPATRRSRTRPTRATAPATASGSSRPPTSTAASPRSAARPPAPATAGGRRAAGAGLNEARAKLERRAQFPRHAHCIRASRPTTPARRTCLSRPTDADSCARSCAVRGRRSSRRPAW